MARFWSQNLGHGWEFKSSDEADDAWLPVAKVPTVVHLDLLDHKKYDCTNP